MTADFAPKKIPTAEFPHPVGSFIKSPTNVWEVVDRDGYAFLASPDGSGSGFHVLRNNGRTLGGPYTPLADFRPQRIPIAMFPFPVGSTALGGILQPYTVTDHDGYAYLLSPQGYGWFPRMESDRLLAELMPLAE